MKEKLRCHWAESDPVLRTYHDEEWGVPQYDSRTLWELLMLEGFQAGLSWLIVLRKRDAFRAAFRNFDPAKVARFKEADVTRLMADPGIIRARAKIEATIGGARIYLEMQNSGTTSPSGRGTSSTASPFRTPALSPRNRRSPQRFQRSSRSAASNSSAPPSSTPGCRHPASSTTTRSTVSVATSVRLGANNNQIDASRISALSFSFSITTIPRFAVIAPTGGGAAGI